MDDDCSIIILEQEPNKLGDLFGRLMGDLFLSLGYEEIRLNIQKSGREIDIEATHRTENRRIIAECRATEKPVGGGEVNKFVGKLDIERRRSKGIDITGYFVSLNGFTETAIEQEKEAGDNRIVPLNGDQVVRELIKGHIIVPREKAMERCGRCAAEESQELNVEEYCQLIAHEMGWIWVIYYARNKRRTHFALVHADGEVLSTSLAKKITDTDELFGDILGGLMYLKPRVEEIQREEEILETKKKYFSFLEAECGEITLEGLPADQNVGSRSLKLENIFVPLHLEEIEESESESIARKEEYRRRSRKKERLSVGQVLSKEQRLAILATPGGGKTTLVKRIALAYAFPDRREAISDSLPEQDWFPLFIRCRQLGEMARSSIYEILGAIAKRAEMKDREDDFLILINRYLRSGEVLLLIDGLDEISDEQIRLSFVKQLRIFLATYPQVKVIITSRIAGFRIVGGQLYATCKHYRLADFDDDDIKRLVVAWHKEVIGDREEIILEAEKLADTIYYTDRVRQLAVNPLLLTTLLLVKRWMGQLPTRRSVLYGKAIEVLLMTWNVEGYEPIDQDEAIPQLAFVAYTMMKEKIQRISSRRLSEILTLARKQMPEILSYTKMSVSEFIQRVELRSSLMILSGHEVEKGTLLPMYEFRHLTFQEYLTAKAVVEGYYPDRKEEDTILTILKPNVKDESWYEVIPLTAVLAGRYAQPLVKYIIDICRDMGEEDLKVDKGQLPVKLLIQSVLDEVQIQPDMLKESLDCIARKSDEESTLASLQLYKGRHGEIWFDSLKQAYLEEKWNLLHIGHNIGQIASEMIGWKEGGRITREVIDKVEKFIDSDNTIDKSIGALISMLMAFSYGDQRPFKKDSKKYRNEEREMIGGLGAHISLLTYCNLVTVHFAACWALAWMGEKNLWSPIKSPDIISRLLNIWMNSTKTDVIHVTSWAICQLPLIDRDLVKILGDSKEIQGFIENAVSSEEYTSELNAFAPLIIGYYMKSPWSDVELGEMAYTTYEKGTGIIHESYSKCKTFLEALGDVGKGPLEKLEKTSGKRRGTRKRVRRS